MGLIEIIKMCFGGKPEKAVCECQPSNSQGEVQRGASQQDIAEYLKKYSADGYPVDIVRPVICPDCGGNICQVSLDADSSVVQVRCDQCVHTRFLLDSEGYWDEAEPQEAVCPDCGGKQYNLAVGMAYRDEDSVKWVYIGCRCVKCCELGCFADWKVEFDREEEVKFFSDSESRPGSRVKK